MSTERGFTLLEVIVAFAILALVLGAAMATMSTGLKSQVKADDALTRLSIAQSTLDRVGNDLPFESQAFDQGSHLVTIDVRRDESSTETWIGLRKVPYHLTVTVSGKDRSGPIRLKALRLGSLL